MYFTIRFTNAQNIPQQFSGSDCGVFVMQVCSCVLLYIELTFLFYMQYCRCLLLHIQMNFSQVGSIPLGLNAVALLLIMYIAM